MNALLIPFVLGAAHPQPRLHADLIGLGTTKAAAESLYEELKELSTQRPTRANGRRRLLGRKCDCGFYTLA